MAKSRLPQKKKKRMKCRYCWVSIRNAPVSRSVGLSAGLVSRSTFLYWLLLRSFVINVFIFSAFVWHFVSPSTRLDYNSNGEAVGRSTRLRAPARHTVSDPQTHHTVPQPILLLGGLRQTEHRCAVERKLETASATTFYHSNVIPKSPCHQARWAERARSNRSASLRLRFRNRISIR
jgi:hypothetical protein